MTEPKRLREGDIIAIHATVRFDTDDTDVFVHLQLIGDDKRISVHVSSVVGLVRPKVNVGDTIQDDEGDQMIVLALDDMLAWVRMVALIPADAKPGDSRGYSTVDLKSMSFHVVKSMSDEVDEVRTPPPPPAPAPAKLTFVEPGDPGYHGDGTSVGIEAEAAIPIDTKVTVRSQTSDYALFTFVENTIGDDVFVNGIEGPFTLRTNGRHVKSGQGADTGQYLDFDSGMPA